MSRRFKVLVCRGPECGDQRGSRVLHDEFRRLLDERGLTQRVELGWQSCFGRCRQGPNCLVREIVAQPGGQRFMFAALPAKRGVTALYNGLTVDSVVELIDQHIIGGTVVRRLIKRPAVELPVRPSPENNE